MVLEKPPVEPSPLMEPSKPAEPSTTPSEPSNGAYVPFKPFFLGPAAEKPAAFETKAQPVTSDDSAESNEFVMLASPELAASFGKLNKQLTEGFQELLASFETPINYFDSAEFFDGSAPGKISLFAPPDSLLEPGEPLEAESKNPGPLPEPDSRDKVDTAKTGDTADTGDSGNNDDSGDIGDTGEKGEKSGLGRRIVSLIGTLLIIASIVTVLSPVWIKYWDRYNPFSTVQDKPVLPVIDLSTADDMDFPEPLPVGATGVLEIPSLALREEISYGIDTVTLENGLGFYPQSGIPARGNVSIAGHRNMAGSPFMYLNELVKGDQIILSYEGAKYTYDVDSVFITNDRDWSVIDPTPVPALTLTTCDPAIRPLDGKYDRLIVRAYLQN